MRRLVSDRRAVTALEYAIIASLIAAVVAASVGTVGQHALTMWQSVVAALPGTTTGL